MGSRCEIRQNCLKSLTGTVHFTFEELYTLLIEIEACLNSRPLCEFSSDPNDLEVLTPGHFLIGSSLNALPEHDITDTKISPLKRWSLIYQIGQRFWKRWTTEYLSLLQSRTKWKVKKPNLKLGDLVIIKNDFQVPRKWPLGRVVKLHTGIDNCVRVVTLKTSKNDVTRPIRQLIPLPFFVDPDQRGGVCQD